MYSDLRKMAAALGVLGLVLFMGVTFASVSLVSVAYAEPKDR
jgi:hypothetical protein